MVVTCPDTVPPKVSGMSYFMIMRLMQFEGSHLSNSFLASAELSVVRDGGQSVLRARSRSVQPRTIKTFFFPILKVGPIKKGNKIYISRYYSSKSISRTK